MARIVLSPEAGINLTVADADTSPTQGILYGVWADSGYYVYAHANGAIAEGAACILLYTGEAADMDTTDSGSTMKVVGINVTTGGLSDNQWGWFWRGCGFEYVKVADAIAADTNLTTTATAGVVGSGGDAITSLNLVTANASGAAALRQAQAGGFLVTNP